MFDHINAVNEPDALFWSGDSISHDVTVETEIQVITKMKKIAGMVYDNFKETPVFAAVGNHDTYPLDIFHGRDEGENEALERYSPVW